MSTRTKNNSGGGVTPIGLRKTTRADFCINFGVFGAECYDARGDLKWADTAKNGVTDIGINNLLDVHFRAQTQITSWFIGLVDNASFTAFAAGDTSASHGGWIESTAYSNANRVTWTTVAAAGKSITNTTTADFNINATATLQGMFLISVSTKGGATGILWATASFSGGTQAVANGDTLKITYTVSAS